MIRYGRPNAGAGPAGGPVVGSGSSGCRGEAIVATLGEGEGADVSGGGSMLECDVGGSGLEVTAGSGNGGMSSSGFRVSMAISFVSMLLPRRW